MNDNNKKVAVQLSYEIFGEYLVDFIDGLIAESRKIQFTHRVPLE